MPDAAVARPLGEDIQKAQLLELVLGLLDRLSAWQPVMFVIEDLHWADQSTLDLTAFLVRSLRGVRVLLVTTYRSDELHRRHPLRPLLTSWERVRSVDQDRRAPVRPRRGRPPSSAAILGGDPAPASPITVFDRSGGNAYLVEELAGAVRADGDLADLPPSLRDVLLSRVDALSPDAQRLLRTAAVAGRAVPDRCWPRWPASARPSCYAALREAVESHLLLVDPSGHGYAFRHALTRDAVYEDMLPGERVRLHAAYGAALDRDPALAGDEAALPAALAYHWYAALDLPRALPAAIDAASARAGLLRPRRGAAPSGAGAGDLAPGGGRRAADRPRPGGGEPSRRRTRRTGRARSTGRCPCSPTRWPSCPADADPDPPGAAARPVRAGAAGLGRAAPRRRVAAAGAGPAAAEAETTRAHAVVLAALAVALMRRLRDGAGRRGVASARWRPLRRSRRQDVEADVAITLGSAISYLGPARGRPGRAPLGRQAGAALSSDIPADRACAATSTCPTCWRCSAGTPRPPRPRGTGCS